MKSQPGNLAVSPASISAALAMAWGGARGQTEAQMRKVLHLEGSREAVMSEWGELSRGLQDPSRALKLRMANRLFAEKTAQFDPGYLKATQAAYGAALEPVDFKTAPDAVRETINTWVEEQTAQRIQNLVPPGAIDSLMRLVLVNAIERPAKEDADDAPARPLPHRPGGRRQGARVALPRADHPFLFAIVDRPTGLVLFLGRVEDPTTR